MRYQISKDQILDILEQHGIDVRMWHVLNDGTFAGAICDGYKPDLAQPKDSPDICELHEYYRNYKLHFKYCPECGVKYG